MNDYRTELFEKMLKAKNSRGMKNIAYLFTRRDTSTISMDEFKDTLVKIGLNPSSRTFIDTVEQYRHRFDPDTVMLNVICQDFEEFEKQFLNSNSGKWNMTTPGQPVGGLDERQDMNKYKHNSDFPQNKGYGRNMSFGQNERYSDERRANETVSSVAHSGDTGTFGNNTVRNTTFGNEDDRRIPTQPYRDETGRSQGMGGNTGFSGNDRRPEDTGFSQSGFNETNARFIGKDEINKGIYPEDRTYGGNSEYSQSGMRGHQQGDARQGQGRVRESDGFGSTYNDRGHNQTGYSQSGMRDQRQEDDQRRQGRVRESDGFASTYNDKAYTQSGFYKDDREHNRIDQRNKAQTQGGYYDNKHDQYDRRNEGYSQSNNYKDDRRQDDRGYSQSNYYKDERDTNQRDKAYSQSNYYKDERRQDDRGYSQSNYYKDDRRQDDRGYSQSGYYNKDYDDRDQGNKAYTQSGYYKDDRSQSEYYKDSRIQEKSIRPEETYNSNYDKHSNSQYNTKGGYTNHMNTDQSGRGYTATQGGFNTSHVKSPREISFREESMAGTNLDQNTNKHSFGKSSMIPLTRLKSNSRQDLDDLFAFLKRTDTELYEDLKQNNNFLSTEFFKSLFTHFMNHGSQMESEFRSQDMDKDGFLGKSAFSSYFSRNKIPFTEDQLNAVLSELRTNSAGFFNYEDLMDKVKAFDESKLTNQIKNYHYMYNPYFMDLRDYLKAENTDLEDILAKQFPHTPQLTFMQFTEVMNTLDNRLHEEELKYIFSKLAERDEIVSVSKFVMVSKMKVTPKDLPQEEKQAEHSNFTSDGKLDLQNLDKLKLPEHQLKQDLHRGFAEMDNKLLQEMREVPVYKILMLIELLNNKFARDNNWLKGQFMRYDRNNTGKVSYPDFFGIIASLNMNINQSEMQLLAENVQNKDNDFLSYKEFCDTVYSYSKQGRQDFSRKYSQFYNPYCEALRKHILTNKIDIATEWNNLFPKTPSIRKQDFTKLMNTIKFRVIHQDELNYIFNMLSSDDVSVELNSMVNFALNPPDKQKVKSEVKSSSWQDSLIKFNPVSAAKHRKNIQSLFPVFKRIKGALEKSAFNSIIEVFSQLIVSFNGECDDSKFIFYISKLDIKKDVQFMQMINIFKVKTTGKFNFVGFINGYNSFFEVDETVDEKEEIDAEEEETVKDMVTFIAEIIIEEKEIGVKDYFYRLKQIEPGICKLASFSRCLEDDLEVELDGRDEEVELLFKRVRDKQRPTLMSLERLIELFQQLSEVGMEPKIKAKKPKPFELFQSFCESLKKNRTKFTDVFPKVKGGIDQVTREDVSNAIQLAKFKISPKDEPILIDFAFNKANKIHLSKLKRKIEEVVPDYFKLAFNKEVDQAKQAERQNLKRNKEIKELIKRVNHFLKENKMTTADLFEKYNKNQDSSIDLTEFINMMLEIDDTLEPATITTFFNFVDSNSGGTVTPGELMLNFTGYKKTTAERKESTVLSSRILTDIHKLFDKFDLDFDNKISKKDFYSALKSMKPQVTMDDVDVIFKRIDSNDDGTIDRSEFVSLMTEHFQNETVIEAEEIEYIIKMFKEEDIDRNGFLTIPQLKHLLVDVLGCSIGEKEFKELVDLTDSNYDGQIDIEEFIAMLNETGYNPCVSSTIRQIKKSRKLSPDDFLKIFDNLPKNFIPSFTKETNKLLKALPSATLRPVTDSSGIFFKDILPREVKVNNELKPQETPVCGRFIFDSATGVPIPDENSLDRHSGILSRTVKMGIWSKKTNGLIGNTFQVNCTWSKNKEDQWGFEGKNEFFNNIILRFDKKDDKLVAN